MYLTRLILDPKSRLVRRDMADCQQLHRTVLSAFPDLCSKDTDARKEFGILHRLDISHRSGTVVLLVQSDKMPDWNLLPSSYLLKDSSIVNPACKSIDEQYEGIADNDIFMFRLRANPTNKTGTSSKSDIEMGKPKSNGTRVPIHGEAAQIEWLKRKANAGGFELLSANIKAPVSDVISLDEGRVAGGKPDTKGGQAVDRANQVNRLSFASIIYEGRLKVVDKAKFLETLNKGIGSGKAYGFGLLSIARAT